MSDSDPLKPSVSTSTVPLKKETVRISLRAQPDESGPIAPRGTGTPVPADATGPTTPISLGDSGNLPTQPLGDPTSAPSSFAGSILPPAPLQAATPTAPPAPPSAPRTPPPPPSAGAPPPPPPQAGIPLSKGPNPLAPTRAVSTGIDPLGPTVPVALTAAVPAPPAGPPRPPGAPAYPAGPVGAKTIPLVKSPQGPGGPGPVGRVTTPLQPGGGARPLPPATVKLDKTTTVGATSGRLAPRPERPLRDTDEEEDTDLELVDAGLMPFAIIVLILSIAVLAIEALTKFGAST